jgi:uncharacterized membrane protein YbhN (UPF0104 family)
MSKHQKRLLNLLLIALIVIFFALYLRDIEYSLISGIEPSWFWLTVASFIALAFRYLGVFVWRQILLNLGVQKIPRFRTLSSIYAKAWMGRYVPGKVTWIAGKVYLAGSLGISKSRLAVASTLEALVQVVAIATVSLLLVGLDFRTAVIWFEIKILLIVIAGVMIVLLHPSIFNWMLQFIHRAVARKPPHPELRSNKKSVYSSFFLYSVGTFVSGASYFFLIFSLVESVSWQLFFYIVGTYGLAGAIGMAIPLLPSGLGVRDGVQLILLSSVFSKEISLMLVVYSRLWSSLIDVVFYFVAELLDRRKN